MKGQLTIRAEVTRTVEQHLGAEAKRPGSVLYSSWHTLRPGKLYLMALNPGGDPEAIPRSVLESLVDSHLEGEAHTAYAEVWDWRGKEQKAGEHQHQRRVKDMVRCLGISDVAKVFAANAIFVRSRGEATLARPNDLWGKCWPVHQLFLSIVRPKVVLCLGNAEGLSAFGLLLSTVRHAQVERGGAQMGFAKHFKSDLDLGAYRILSGCTVVGVRHPSRFPVYPNLKAFLESLARTLGN